MNIDTRLPSKGDRNGLYIYTGFGVVAVAVVLWQTVRRLIEVAPGRDIPVSAAFEQAASLPIGPGGALVDAAVTRAVVSVPDPAGATLFALWAHPIVTGVAWIAGIVVAALFCIRLARGRAFERNTAHLVYAGAIVYAVGWFSGSMLAQISANGALSAISDYTYDNVQAPFDWSVVFALFVLAAVGIALQVGERMQRDTEGLV